MDPVRRTVLAGGLLAPALGVAAAPARAANAQIYFVFFDFEITEMTPEAISVVDQAAQYALNAHPTEIEIVGHADTLEGSGQAYSLLRALAVEIHLVRQGVNPYARFITRGAGAAEPLVATGRDVREPQNRFVRIEMR